MKFVIIARRHDWSTAFAVEEWMGDQIVDALNQPDPESDSWGFAVISVPIIASEIEASLNEMRAL